VNSPFLFYLIKAFIVSDINEYKDEKEMTHQLIKHKFDRTLVTESCLLNLI